jgi:hypothetical protein
LRHPRHALVVATQCGEEDELPELVETAAELHEVLTDPALGACEETPAAHAATVRSGCADRACVDATVREAITRAGAAHAVLVLALIGHGQSPPGSNTLYYMSADAESGNGTHAVDVNSLISCAVNQPGIAGVVLLLDTCHAGAGLPSAQSLLGGYLQGRTRISALAASQSQQAAYDLDFTRELTRLIREGFDDVDEFVPLRRYRSALTEKLVQQESAALEYDGSLSVAEEGLWLAVNARHRVQRSSVQLSDVGEEDLRQALRTWPEAAVAPRTDGRLDLEDLRDRAARSGTLGGVRVAEVAHALVQAGRTEAFIVGWAGNALTTFTMTRAMKELNKRRRVGTHPLRPPAELQGNDLLRYFLQHEALRGTSMDGRTSCDLSLARCLVAIAEVCMMDLTDPALEAWAAENGTIVALNDARDEVRTAEGERRAGAVISLHAARLDWPESVSAWVRHDGTCSPPRHFPCRASQSGVEELLPDVVYWAEDQLPAGTWLSLLDIVVPAALFPHWRPEEVKVGLQWLGVDRTVTLRWSDRLVEPRHLRGLNELGRRQLEACSTAAFTRSAPVDWLGSADVTDLQELKSRLAMGWYERAIGLGHRDREFAQLLQTLLPYTPVLLWPGDDRTNLPEPPPGLMRRWERLPAEFTRAYRRRWLTNHAGPGGSEPGGDEVDWDELARLRAAWHDEPWLDFCRWYQKSTASALRST